MNPHPPADEAVKAAFEYVETNSNASWAAMAELCVGYEFAKDAAARILAARARVLSAELDVLKKPKPNMEMSELYTVATAHGYSKPLEMMDAVDGLHQEVERLRAALEEIGYVAGRMEGRGETCSSFANSIKGILSEALAGKDGA